MNERDILRIAKQSAKKLGLPSRSKRILLEYFDDFLWFFVATYIRIVFTVVPKRYRHLFFNP